MKKKTDSLIKHNPDFDEDEEIYQDSKIEHNLSKQSKKQKKRRYQSDDESDAGMHLLQQ